MVFRDNMGSQEKQDQEVKKIFKIQQIKTMLMKLRFYFDAGPTGNDGPRGYPGQKGMLN